MFQGTSPSAPSSVPQYVRFFSALYLIEPWRTCLTEKDTIWTVQGTLWKLQCGGGLLQMQVFPGCISGSLQSRNSPGGRRPQSCESLGTLCRSGAVEASGIAVFSTTNLNQPRQIGITWVGPSSQASHTSNWVLGWPEYSIKHELEREVLIFR